MVEEYDDRDILNANKTGHFVRSFRKISCFKSKNSGSLLLLCWNMLGDFETSVVIEEAKKSRCFNNIDGLKQESVDNYRDNERLVDGVRQQNEK